MGVIQVAEEGLDRNGLRVVTGLQVELHAGLGRFLVVVFRIKEAQKPGRGQKKKKKVRGEEGFVFLVTELCL